MVYFLVALIGLWVLFPKSAAQNPKAVISGVILLILILGGMSAG